MGQIYDLTMEIRRLEAEVERLRGELGRYSEELEEWIKTGLRWKGVAENYNSLQAENAKLRGELGYLTKKNEARGKLLDIRLENIEKLEAENVKLRGGLEGIRDADVVIKYESWGAVKSKPTLASVKRFAGEILSEVVISKTETTTGGE